VKDKQLKLVKVGTGLVKDKRLLVVKVGTSSLRNARVFYRIASQIAEAKKLGVGVVLLTSGAVDAGRNWVELLEGNPEDFNPGELSGIGSLELLTRWKEAFLPHHLGIVLGWVTNGTWSHKGERENLRTAARKFAWSNFVLVVNEHDLLSRRELEKMKRGAGDNDYLARRVAKLIGATDVLFLTEVGGITDGDPKALGTRRYLEIDGRTTMRLGKRNSGKSAAGTGGPQSKINQASICYRLGMQVAIAGATEADVVVKFLKGEQVGTIISDRTVLA